MKVRIDNDLLVFRLNDSERDDLKERGVVSVSIPLVNNELPFVLRTDEHINSITIDDKENEVSVAMPASFMDEWDEMKVGFEEKIEIRSDKVLKVIIEKDLKRSKRRNKGD